MFTITSTAATVRATIATGSFGKRSNLDIKWQREFTRQKHGGLNNYIGIKYHIKHEHPVDEIMLHNFSDGYCGMSKIEENKSCLCYLTTAKNLRNSGNSIDEMQKKILFKNPKLKAIFTNAEFLYQKPLSISQVSFDKKTLVENHVLMTGDAAGLITPLCGNGMSMAMHSAKIAFEAIQDYLSNKSSYAQLESDIPATVEKNFR